MYTYMKTLNLNICSEQKFLRFFGPFDSMKNSPAGHVPVDFPGFEPNQLPMTHVLQAMHDLKSCQNDDSMRWNCWWFQKSGENQLRLVVYPLIYIILYI